MTGHNVPPNPSPEEAALADASWITHAVLCDEVLSNWAYVHHSSSDGIVDSGTPGKLELMEPKTEAKWLLNLAGDSVRHFDRAVPLDGDRRHVGSYTFDSKGLLSGFVRTETYSPSPVAQLDIPEIEQVIEFPELVTQPFERLEKLICGAIEVLTFKREMNHGIIIPEAQEILRAQLLTTVPIGPPAPDKT